MQLQYIFWKDKVVYILHDLQKVMQGLSSCGCSGFLLQEIQKKYHSYNNYNLWNKKIFLLVCCLKISPTDTHPWTCTHAMHTHLWPQTNDSMRHSQQHANTHMHELCSSSTHVKSCKPCSQTLKHSKLHKHMCFAHKQQHPGAGAMLSSTWTHVHALFRKPLKKHVHMRHARKLKCTHAHALCSQTGSHLHALLHRNT